MKTITKERLAQLIKDGIAELVNDITSDGLVTLRWSISHRVTMFRLTK